MNKMICAVLTVFLLVSAAGCNYQAVDLTYKFDEAVIAMPDGTTVSGKVQSWRDYEDGDQIQVKIDGVTYLVHSVNVVLIAK